MWAGQDAVSCDVETGELLLFMKHFDPSLIDVTGKV